MFFVVSYADNRNYYSDHNSKPKVSRIFSAASMYSEYINYNNWLALDSQ